MDGTGSIMWAGCIGCIGCDCCSSGMAGSPIPFRSMNWFWRPSLLGEADLLQEEAVVVLEVLLDDPAVPPASDGREHDFERLAGRVDDRPVGQLERLRERPREWCDEGRELALSEQDVVRVLDL